MSSRGVLVALASAAVLTSCDWYEKEHRAGDFGTGAGRRPHQVLQLRRGIARRDFYAGNRKMTATLSATGGESPNGVTYGNAGDGGFYITIAAGQHTLSGRSPIRPRRSTIWQSRT